LATWDVFHSGRLEVERSLTTEAVRAALARGDLLEDDLIRPSGTTVAWQRLAELAALLEPPPIAGPAAAGLADSSAVARDDGPDEEPGDGSPSAAEPAARAGDAATGPWDLDLDRTSDSHVALPVAAAGFLNQEELGPFDPQDEDEEVAAFTLARDPVGRVEELDLAAMVDVAFQLVLFFLVTATTVLYKTLEVPKPSPDRPPAAATQGQNRTLDDLQREYILVEIDAQGAIRVDHEPIAAADLIERLRQARQDTARTAMLLSADFATPHRNAVLAYDAANEIGLRIAIAKPGSER
jgi:biopolymer transport protein ExbD